MWRPPTQGETAEPSRCRPRLGVDVSHRLRQLDQTPAECCHRQKPGRSCRLLRLAVPCSPALPYLPETDEEPRELATRRVRPGAIDPHCSRMPHRRSYPWLERSRCKCPRHCRCVCVSWAVRILDASPPFRRPSRRTLPRRVDARNRRTDRVADPCGRGRDRKAVDDSTLDGIGIRGAGLKNRAETKRVRPDSTA